MAFLQCATTNLLLVMAADLSPAQTWCGRIFELLDQAKKCAPNRVAVSNMLINSTEEKPWMYLGNDLRPFSQHKLLSANTTKLISLRFRGFTTFKRSRATNRGLQWPRLYLMCEIKPCSSFGNGCVSRGDLH